MPSVRKNNIRRILYISYNGVQEPLVHSQVLSYLRALGAMGYEFHLITFEKQILNPEQVMSIQSDLEEIGVRWQYRRYHRWPRVLATALDVLSGVTLGTELVRSNRIELLHCRSFIAALMGLGVRLLTRIPYIYDIRGFWIEEKVMKGSLKKPGFAYTVGRKMESLVYAASAGIVSLTEVARTEITGFPVWQKKPMPPVVVIPTCVDLTAYRESTRSSERGCPVMGYVGSLGPGYLADRMMQFFAAAIKADLACGLEIYTRSDVSIGKRLADINGIDESMYRIRSVEPAEVPGVLAEIDVGLCLIEPHYSKMASMPTKLAEYLAAGVPVVANTIGDVASIIERFKVGVVIDDFSRGGTEIALQQLELLLREPALGERCRAAARTVFSVDDGAKAYKNLYNQALDGQAE